nr:hypothetical protein [Tanacetum cinerariifolium]
MIGYCKKTQIADGYFGKFRLFMSLQHKSTRYSNAGNDVGRRYYTVKRRCPTALGLALAGQRKAIEYHEWLLQQEAQPRLTRTPIFRDHKDAERRLRADYFDDH